MIHNLKISYIKENIHYTLELDVGYDNDNLPYDLAECFSRIIEDSNANYEIVIKSLKENFIEE